jgi:hypothetical protein
MICEPPSPPPIGGGLGGLAVGPSRVLLRATFQGLIWITLIVGTKGGCANCRSMKKVGAGVLGRQRNRFICNELTRQTPCAKPFCKVGAGGSLGAGGRGVGCDVGTHALEDSGRATYILRIHQKSNADSVRAILKPFSIVTYASRLGIRDQDFTYCAILCVGLYPFPSRFHDDQ